MPRLFLLAPLLFLFPLSSAHASTADPESDAAAIVDLFYDLQFASATAAANDLAERYPGYPAGAFYRSVIAYQRLTLEDPRTQKTRDEFEAASLETFSLAEALASSAPAVSHFYRGAALGFQARALAAGKHYSAARGKAKQGVRHLREALRLDPSFEDAYLGLGMYDYFISQIPIAAKPFAFMAMGDWGHRTRGLEELKRVAETGKAAKMEARSLLAMIYIRKKEQNWEEAARYLRPLVETYPHNPRYRLALIYVLERQWEWEAAAALAESPDAPWVQAIDPWLQPRVKAAVRMRLEEITNKAPVAAFKWPLPPE